jgi:poly(beta-D-mannuronate) lyase
MIKKCSYLLFIAALLACGISQAKDYLVTTPKAYKEAVKKLTPGDSIILKNGVWRDFEILFVGQGTASKPISLTAETKGSVILSGQSNLRIAGEHLLVSGLVFKDGYTPTGEVVAFKRNDQHLANNSRITEVVIDNYSNPDKDSSDYWVALYGKNNRFDHNHLAGKRNNGVTMAVRLNAEANQQNHHRIDHNYFGPRPILGSNGGETLRVGTSTYSLTDSFTLIENNYFDRCNGEVEIISIKSGKNTIRNNVFFESRGTLTLRHGNGNLVEGNVFFGNGVEHTGGIRVINHDQIIRNNYLEGLTGSRFGSGFAVMNGAVNPPINRYHQVVNATIENNTFINVDNIQLAAGSDAERNAAPTKSVMRNNFIYNESGLDPFSVFDKVDGITFDNNYRTEVKNPVLTKGFIAAPLKFTRRANGLLMPEGDKFNAIGINDQLNPVKKSAVGAAWYPKAEPEIAFDSGKKIIVKPGEGNLFNALKRAASGDTLVLSEGVYNLQKLLTIDKVLTFEAAKAGAVTLMPTRSVMFELVNGGALKLKAVRILGDKAPDAAGNTLIRTMKCGMLYSYRLIIENSDIENLNVNHSYHLFDAGSRSLASEINLIGSRFKNITGDLLRLNKEIDDLGIYNAEYVRIDKSQFENVEGVVVNLYRGGTDESTFGPHLLVSHNEFKQVAKGARNKTSAIFNLQGVQFTRIDANSFDDTAKIVIKHTVGDPDTLISNNSFKKVAAMSTEELHTKGKSTVQYVNNRTIK